MFFYIILWCCLLFYYIRRDKNVSLGIVLLLLYTIQSFVALLVYTAPQSDYKGLDMQIWPFFYLFVLIYISLKPILDLKECSLSSIEIPNSKINTALCVFFSLFAIISIINIWPQIGNGLQLMMVSDNEGILDVYGDSTAIKSTQRSFSGIFSFQGVISNMSSYIIPLLFFTYYVKKERSRLVLVLLSIALLQGPLTGIANASRLQLIDQIFVFFLLFFFFRPYIRQKDKRTFKWGFLILISLLFLVLARITIARTSPRTYTGDTLYNIESYFASGPINFNAYCMDANGTREGYRVAPLFLQIMGKESLTPEQVRFKFQHMKIDSSSFTTYVGDFVLDFGPVATFFIFLSLSVLFSLMLRNRRSLNYGQVTVVFIIVKFCSGYYQFGFSNVGGNLGFLMLLTLAVLFNSRKWLNNNSEIIRRQ